MLEDFALLNLLSSWIFFKPLDPLFTLLLLYIFFIWIGATSIIDVVPSGGSSSALSRMISNQGDFVPTLVEELYHLILRFDLSRGKYLQSVDTNDIWLGNSLYHCPSCFYLSSRTYCHSLMSFSTGSRTIPRAFHRHSPPTRLLFGGWRAVMN